MWLEWQPAALLACAFAATVLVVRPIGQRWAVVVSAFAQELAVMFTLYGIWRLANHLSLMQVDGAIWRGHWLWDLERSWHLPSEVTIQQMVLPHPLVTQLANVYYAVAHVPAAIIFLVWLFSLHRPAYPRIRNVLALTTLACLLIQLVPVAPPRLIPDLGVVDAPLLYHQSVYGPIGTGIAAQLSAMPSVHVAWALIVGLGAVMVSTSRWRWFVLAHPILTCWAVVATGNHYWVDGLAAAVILALAFWAQRWHPVLALTHWVRGAPAVAVAPPEPAVAAEVEPAAVGADGA
jgi:hypothetical protein